MALPNYGDIVALLKKGLTVEAQEQIMALREGAMELQEENLELRKENGELRAKLELRGKVVHKPPFFYLAGENKPLCPKCWQEKNNSVYLVALNNGYQQCPVCKFGHSTAFGGGRVETEWDPFKESCSGYEKMS